MEGGCWQKTSRKLLIRNRGGSVFLSYTNLKMRRMNNADCSVTNPLSDPILELHSAGGQIVAANDNWQTTQKAQIIATGLAPADPHESAIFAILPASNFTAVVRGVGKTTGVAWSRL